LLTHHTSGRGTCGDKSRVILKLKETVHERTRFRFSCDNRGSQETRPSHRESYSKKKEKGENLEGRCGGTSPEHLKAVREFKPTLQEYTAGKQTPRLRERKNKRRKVTGITGGFPGGSAENWKQRTGIITRGRMGEKKKKGEVREGRGAWGEAGLLTIARQLEEKRLVSKRLV